MMWWVTVVLHTVAAEQLISNPPELSKISVDETRGYELGGFQLIQPYSNAMWWKLYGDTFITRNRIRLTRDEMSLNGSIWSNTRLKVRDWEIQAHFRIIASNGETADGMAIWYTNNSGTGTAWGAPSNFSGIGVVLDTYVNEISENVKHQSTRLFILFNSNMKKQVDLNVDGRNMMFGEKCDLGNDVYFTKKSQHHDVIPTVKILIRYLMETLEVYYFIPSLAHKHWQFCTNLTDVFLPTHYHLGISAATGERKSVQELLSFRVYELNASNHVFEKPVPFPVIIRNYTIQFDIEQQSSLEDEEQPLTTTEFWILIVFLVVIMYVLYAITDRWIDESFIMARPRRRFY